MELPALGEYVTGILFLDTATRQKAEEKFTDLARDCGLTVLLWRTVPVLNEAIGDIAMSREPLIRQVCTCSFIQLVTYLVV